MEKPTVTTQVSSVYEEDGKNKHAPDVSAGMYWKPGYLRRFPFLGFGGTILVLLCSLASVAVLVASNDKPSSIWPERIAPNVVLSVLNAISNLALAIAISKGSAIAWWRKAMHGATVMDLHNSWSQSASTYEILKHLFRLDTIGIAALAAKICVIDGVLFQRATTTYIGQDHTQNITMLGVAATEFPQTGFIIDEGFGAQSNCGCFMVGDQFTPIVNNWETSNGFFKGYNKYFQSCDGTCFTHIEAIGFEIDCTKQADATNLATNAIAAYDSSGGSSSNSSAWTDLPIFNSSFSVSFANATRNYSTIDFSLRYFQSQDPYNPSSATCPGTVFTVECAMRPALVTYPVTITNYTNAHIINGVALGDSISHLTATYDDINAAQVPPVYSFTNKQALGFSVGEYLNPVEGTKLGSSTRLGGIANALSQYLSSTALITYTAAQTWALKQQGTLAQTMMYGPPNMGSCDCSFYDISLDSIVNSVNQLTFMTATGSIDPTTWTFPQAEKSTVLSPLPSTDTPKLTVNSSTSVTVMGIDSNLTTNFRNLEGSQEIRDVVFYKTQFLYMGLGAGFTFFCVLLVCPIYWKYGELGREVTLGPIEIAGAFRAPILTHAEQPQVSTESEDHPPPTPMSPAPPSPAPATIAFANVDQLLNEVGGRKVTYGFVDVEEAHHTAPGSPTLSPGAAAFHRRSVLAFQNASDPNARSAVSPPTSPRV